MSIDSFGLTLYKGADLPDGLKYWAVEDTYIDNKTPEQNFGRDINLCAGPKKILLIRFGDLVRAVGPYKISDSELILKGNFKATQKLLGVWKVLKNWEEGSGSTEPSFGTPLEKLWDKNIVVVGGSTWKNRCRGQLWSSFGLINGSDASLLEGISAEIHQGMIIIKGLGKFIQNSLEYPQDNHGLAIQFSEDVEISSSEAPIEERPKLVIKPTSEKIILNPKVRLYDSKRLLIKTVKFLVSPEIESQLNHWIKEQGYVDQKAWFVSCLNTFNDQFMEHSRYSFVPEGTTLRLIDTHKDTADLKLEINSIQQVNHIIKIINSLLTNTLGLTIQEEIRRPLKIDGTDIWRTSSFYYGGILKRGDTRDERLLPTWFFLQNEPWYDSILTTTYLSSTDLLSACGVIELEKSIHAPLSEWKPERVMVKTCNSWGGILPESDVQLFKNGEKIGMVKTDLHGYFLLPKEINHQLKSSEYLYMKINHKGNESWSILNGASILETYGRGNQHVVMISSRFSIPSGMVENSNLAKGKLVSDSKRSYPAQMISLTQENSTKAVTHLKKIGEWIEVDLGRDRPIGQIVLELKGIQMPKFEIRFYSTGQKSDESILWTREECGDWTIKNLSSPVEKKENIWKINYYGFPTSTRFIRIVCRENNKELNLVNIKAYAPALNPEKNN